MELIPKRDYFFCSYCGTYHFLKENEDGVKIFGLKDKTKCPECKDQLLLGSISNEIILHCDSCRGNLVKTSSVTVIINDNKFREQTLPSKKKQILMEGDRPKHHACPSCHEKMDSHPYHGQGLIYIESCGNCKLVWFDYKEILLLG
jgi:Zn-finger nucleic acid-binding protein